MTTHAGEEPGLENYYGGAEQSLFCQRVAEEVRSYNPDSTRNNVLGWFHDFSVPILSLPSAPAIKLKFELDPFRNIPEIDEDNNIIECTELIETCDTQGALPRDAIIGRYDFQGQGNGPHLVRSYRGPCNVYLGDNRCRTSGSGSSGGMGP